MREGEGGGGPPVAARVVSLLLALAISGAILVYPLFVGGIGGMRHGVLAVTLLGVSAGFVHGVGFIPEPRFLRVLFGPWFGWPAMVFGAAFLLW